MPKHIVKPAICAAWMGAHFVASRNASIMDTLLVHHDGDWKQARRSIRRLEIVSEAYVDAARFLGNSLWFMIEDPVCDGRVRRLLSFERRGEGIYLRNAADGQLLVRELDGGNPHDPISGRRHTTPQLKAKMVSHLLTGCERQFMRALILELENLKIPYIDMHDGLLAHGVVPPKAIKSATKQSVMAAYVQMKAKPLCDPHDNRYSALLTAIGMTWEEAFLSEC